MAYKLYHQQKRNEHELLVLKGKWSPAAYAHQLELRKRWNKLHKKRCAEASRRFREKKKAAGFNSGDHSLLLWAIKRKDERLKRKQEELARVLKKRSNKALRKSWTKAQRYDAKVWPRWRTYTEGSGKRRAEVRMALSRGV